MGAKCVGMTRGVVEGKRPRGRPRGGGRKREEVADRAVALVDQVPGMPVVVDEESRNAVAVVLERHGLTLDYVGRLLKELGDAQKYVPRHGMEPDNDIRLRAVDATMRLQERAGVLPREAAPAAGGGRLRIFQIRDGVDTFIEWQPNG